MKAEFSLRVNRRIGSLSWTPHMEQNVLRHIREHTKPKTHYRLSVVLALVLLMVLLLATATAALLGWKPFADRVLELEPGSVRGFPGWSLESKLELVEEMRAAEMDMSMFSGYEKMAPEQQDQWLNERLRQAWSGELAFASGNILEKIRGPFYTWSLEDKAWFSQKLFENDRLSKADEINLIPKPTDYSEEEAVLKAEGLLLAEYGHITQEMLNLLVPAVYFYRLPEQPEAPFWKVEYRDEYGAILYSVTYKADGSSPAIKRMPTQEEMLEVARKAENRLTHDIAGILELEKDKGDVLFWSLEDKAKYLGSPMPGPMDLPLLEAQQLAKEAIMTRFPLSQEALDALPWGAYYTHYQTEAMTVLPMYSITFVVDDLNMYAVIINAVTGEVFLLQGPDEANG